MEQTSEDTKEKNEQHHNQRRLFANQKMYDRNFKGQDLTHADFRGCTLVGCNFDNADLSYATLEGANCYKSTFRQTRLYHANLKDAVLAETIMDPRDLFGVSVSITCDTFDRMQLGERWIAAWLYMLTLCQMVDGFRQKIVELIGPKRVEALDRAFKERQL